jgi:hypothetical protein
MQCSVNKKDVVFYHSQTSKMRYLSLIILLITFSITLSAQKVVDVTKQEAGVLGLNLFYSVSGEPILTAKFVKITEGTPFYKDEWKKSSVILSNGAEVKDVPIKLNLLENKVHFLDKNGKELISYSPIREVVITDDVSGENSRFVSSTYLHSNPPKSGWYQWLHSGDAALFKYINKDVSETKPYGSATVEQRIRTSEKYYVLYNNTFFLLKSLKDIPNVLANKKGELEQHYQQISKMKTTADDKFTQMILYYNLLLKQ